MKQILSFTLNGVPRDIAVAPTETLLDILRLELGYTGTKRGCDSGDCGACTVLVDGAPQRACLTMALTLQGKNVVTVEGLSGNGDYLPIQKAFMEHGAFQCGYCTSGMVICAVGLLAKNPKPTRQQAKEWMAGNLCRCGAYEEILDAIMAIADQS